MTDSKVLHTELRLWATTDSYTFEPKGKGRTLTIDRRTGELYLNAHNTPLPTQRSPAVTVYGIYGIISLATCDFLIVITNRQHHGQVLGHDIYRATDFKVLPISSGSTASHLLNHPVEKHLLSLVHSHLNSAVFWFSYTWDLTRRLQAQWVAQEESKGLGMWESVDQRFFWNSYLQTKLVDTSQANPEQDLSQFILPVIYGTFVITSARINNQPFQFCLISRRSRFRAGTRYMMRGIDDHGHVANFNETEQIVILRSSSTPPRDTTLSFVQTRGSVPVYWAEVNTLRYKPDLQVMELPQTAASVRHHLEEQTALYGSQQLVNLVNQKGYEKPVKEAYERGVKALDMDKVKYEYFDFHNECKNMRWDRIELLIDRIRSSLDQQGYFHHSPPSEPAKLQLGTVRTNCMDNLDRTNVVQSSLAKWSLTQQLRAIGVLLEKERVDDHPEFMAIFRNVWADHADDIAMAYAGSGALKADFTRTGVRSRQGLMKDGYNSITRYFKNNFFDGPRQDSFDLMTGTWVARRGPGVGISFLLDKRPLIIRAMPYIMSFAIFMLLAGLTLPRTSDYSLTYYFAVCLILATLPAVFISAHGIQYVSWPKLNPRTENIWYDGPGFRSGQHGKGFNFAVPGLKPKMPGVGISPRLPNPYHKYEEVEMGTKKRTD